MGLDSCCRRMLKIFFVVLLSAAMLKASPSNGTEATNAAVFSDDCTDCHEIPCELTNDPTCTIRTYYKPGAQFVSFQIRMKTLYNEWIGIVLNSADLPGMVNISY